MVEEKIWCQLKLLVLGGGGVLWLVTRAHVERGMQARARRGPVLLIPTYRATENTHLLSLEFPNPY